MQVNLEKIKEVTRLIETYPELRKQDAFKQLEKVVQTNQIYEESSEEEDLPPIQNKFELLKEFEQKLKLPNPNIDMIISSCDNMINTNESFAKAHRIKSLAMYKKNKYKDAYVSMSEAQKIDYQEEFSDIHREMKQKLELEEKISIVPPNTPRDKKQSANTSIPNSNNIPNMPSIPNMNPDMFNNIAEKLMSNPEMMNMVHNFANNFKS